MALFCKNGEHVEAGTSIHWGAGIEGEDDTSRGPALATSLGT